MITMIIPCNDNNDDDDNDNNYNDDNDNNDNDDNDNDNNDNDDDDNGIMIVRSRHAVSKAPCLSGQRLKTPLLMTRSATPACSGGLLAGPH